MNPQARLLLTELLTGDEDGLGARLRVLERGDLTFEAPLARTWRLDNSEESQSLLWVRPVVGRLLEPAGTSVFDPSIARRRALEYRTCRISDRQVVLDLVDGQQALISPATPEQCVELRYWDTWLLTRVDAATEKEIDGLMTDS